MALTVYATPSNVKSLSASALMQRAPAWLSSQPRFVGAEAGVLRSYVVMAVDQRLAPSRGLPDMDAVSVGD